MADVPAWRMGEFLRIVLLYLWSRPDGSTSREILLHVQKTARLTPDETGPYPSAPAFLAYEILVRGAMTAVARAGWLDRDGFRWFLTSEGRQVCRDFDNAAEFYTESQRIMDEWQQAVPAAQIILEEAEEQAWSQVRRYLLGLRPHEFRGLVCHLLEALDYHIIWAAPPGRDRGPVDLIASTEPLGVGQPRLLVQVRHTGQPVTVGGVQVILAALGGEDSAVLFSSSGFTREARELVGSQAQHQVGLIDLERFYGLWVEFNADLSEEAHRKLPLQAVHYLSPQED